MHSNNATELNNKWDIFIWVGLKKWASNQVIINMYWLTLKYLIWPVFQFQSVLPIVFISIEFNFAFKFVIFEKLYFYDILQLEIYLKL